MNTHGNALRGELTLLYTHIEKIGYGRLGEELAAALKADGYDVFERQGRDFEIRFPERDDRVKLTNVLCSVGFPSNLNGWYDGQQKVCFTMFEATRLPEGFVECLHEYETILVPSDQNVDLFSAYHDNVHKVPLGVNTERWKYVKRTPPETFFNFLICGSGPRKGVDLTIQAFELAFPKVIRGEWRYDDGPIPHLISKSPKPHDLGGSWVEQMNGHLPPEDEIGLYAAAHCYVQPSRGEGFGLQPLQAICQGIPTILTAAHGHKDFSHYGWGLPTTLGPTAYFSEGHAGQWWEPNLDCLVDAMRWIYENYDKAETIAANNARLAGARFTWANTARRFVQAIGERSFVVPYAGSSDWRSTKPRLFRTRTHVNTRCEVGATPYEFTIGEDKMVPANVKRTLFEMGALDPECLSMYEPGMNEHMVNEYTQRFTYCPRCQVRSGTGVTKWQDIEAQLIAEAGESNIPQTEGAR